MNSLTDMYRTYADTAQTHMHTKCDVVPACCSVAHIYQCGLRPSVRLALAVPALAAFSAACLKSSPQEG